MKKQKKLRKYKSISPPFSLYIVRAAYLELRVESLEVRD